MGRGSWTHEEGCVCVTVHDSMYEEGGVCFTDHDSLNTIHGIHGIPIEDR